MTIRLNGQTSGYVELEAPDAAGSNTLILPDGNGSSGQYLQTNGSGTLSWQSVTDTGLVKTVGTDTNITGASTFNMTGIAAGAEEIVMYWSDFYTSGGAHWHFRFGTEENNGTIYTTGYVDHSHFSSAGSSSGSTYNTTLINFNGAGSSSTNTYDGMIRISKRKDYEYYYQAYTSHKNAGYWWQTIGTWTANSDLTKIQWIVSGGTQTISGGTAQIAYWS